MVNQVQPPIYQQPFPQQQFQQQYQPPKRCTFKQSRDFGPSPFSGSPDPTVTLNWLREVEKAFEACQCKPELKVTYASRLLKDRAMVWWDSVIASVPPEQVRMITREQFYAKVCEQYCNVFDMNRIKMEFLEMRMTQMSIDEVIEKYMDKLRFMQQWVPDEQSRIQHFVNMIFPEYRTFVRSAPTLSQSFVMAKMVESDVRAARGMIWGNIAPQGNQATS
ncbi:uncharacterized protein [Rutidosis leptorrhynchoides]|uniref:uncharacterized protein n=1 Tax=Rutidosis leptorrhynchoides TaxID=125765 RepID=UPI003A9A65BD